MKMNSFRVVLNRINSRTAECLSPPAPPPSVISVGGKLPFGRGGLCPPLTFHPHLLTALSAFCPDGQNRGHCPRTPLRRA